MVDKQPDTLNEQSIRDWVEKWKEVWESGDVDRVLSLLSDDIVMEDPTVPETLHGKEAVKEFPVALFHAFPKMEFELLGEPYLSLDGTKAAIQYRFMDTMQRELNPPGLRPPVSELSSKLLTPMSSGVGFCPITPSFLTRLAWEDNSVPHLCPALSPSVWAYSCSEGPPSG